MSRVANLDFSITFLPESAHSANCEIILQISKTRFFFVFLHEPVDLVTFGTILRISKIYKLVKRGFFSYLSTN